MVVFQLVSVWKVSIPLYYHSIGIRKHSPYFKMMSQGINRMRENGELNVKFNRHLDDFPNCKPLYTQVKALGIKKLAMVFVILIFSFGLAFLVFVLESQVACKLCSYLDTTFPTNNISFQKFPYFFQACLRRRKRMTHLTKQPLRKRMIFSQKSSWKSWLKSKNLSEH